MRRSFVLLAFTLGCHGHAVVTVRPAFASSCVAGLANSLRAEIVGDFPPASINVVAAPMGDIELSVPPGARGIELRAYGSAGLVGFGQISFKTPSGLDRFVGTHEIGVPLGAVPGICTASRLGYARADHSATLRANGDVLLAGGYDAAGFAVTVLERYDPSRATFDTIAPTSALIDSRQALGHAAVLLDSGDVIIAGGAAAAAGRPIGIASEANLRVTATLSAGGTPEVLTGGPRAYHTGTLLADGRVFFAGGCERFDAGSCAGEPLRSTVLYDPATHSAVRGPDLPVAMARHSAWRDGAGDVVLVGEFGAARFSPRDGTMLPIVVSGTSAARLSSGAVVILDAQHVLRLYEPTLTTVLATLGTFSGSSVMALGGGALVVGRTLESLDGHFSRQTFSQTSAEGVVATPLEDGTALLSGGHGSGVISSAATSVLFANRVGQNSSPPTYPFDELPEALSLTRPADATLVGGSLRMTETASPTSPRNLALLFPVVVADFTLDVIVSLGTGAKALVVVDFASVEHFTFLEVGATSSRVVRDGETVCEGSAGAGSRAALAVAYRGGRLIASNLGLSCVVPRLGGRTTVGVGVNQGQVEFDNLSVTR